MKSHNKFYKDISIAEGLSFEEMFRFSDANYFRWEGNKWKYKCQSISINDADTEYAFIWCKTTPNEKTLVSKIPNIIMRKM